MKKVLIINEGYSNNLGDQAINQSIINFFESKGYLTFFLFFSNPSIETLPNYKYIFDDGFKVKPKSIISKLKSYFLFFYWFIKYKKTIINSLRKDAFDIVIIGGGQLIISSGSFALSSFSIVLYWHSLLIKKYSKAKLYMIGVGVSKSFNIFEVFLFSKSLNRVNKVWVRDSFSKKIIKEIYNKEAELIPDIAFYSKTNEFIIKKEKKDLALIGITNYNEVYSRYNATKEYSKNDYFKELLAVVQKYKAKNCQVKLFYTTIPDAQECRIFKIFLEDKFNIKVDICKIENIDNLIVSFDLAKYVYSGRMHALILGMKSNCVVEPYLISQKLKSFNEEYIKESVKINELRAKIDNELKVIL